MYIVSLGRFAQEDPAGDVNGEDLYQLEGSSPVGNSDPSGLQSENAGKGGPSGPGSQSVGTDATGDNQFQEIEKAQRASKKKRPSIDDEDDDWDGCKTRPKQNRINSSRKSEQEADQDNEDKAKAAAAAAAAAAKAAAAKPAPPSTKQKIIVAAVTVAGDAVILGLAAENKLADGTKYLVKNLHHIDDWFYVPVPGWPSRRYIPGTH